MKDWVYYALALIGLVGLPLMSTFVARAEQEVPWCYRQAIREAC